MKNCIFCKIAKGEIPKEFTYKDNDIMVFSDLHPRTPIHLLIVPKIHVADLMDTSNDLLLKMCEVAKKMVEKTHLENKGFRLVINAGGAQIIKHLHLHLLGPLGSEAEL